MSYIYDIEYSIYNIEYSIYNIEYSISDRNAQWEAMQICNVLKGNWANVTSPSLPILRWSGFRRSKRIERERWPGNRYHGT